jgi:hypothetical protein
MIMDVDQAAQAMKEAEIENFLEGFNQPTYRGMRVNGQRAPSLSEDHPAQAYSAGSAEHHQAGLRGSLHGLIGQQQGFSGIVAALLAGDLAEPGVHAEGSCTANRRAVKGAGPCQSDPYGTPRHRRRDPKLWKFLSSSGDE